MRKYFGFLFLLVVLGLCLIMCSGCTDCKPKEYRVTLVKTGKTWEIRNKPHVWTSGELTFKTDNGLEVSTTSDVLVEELP